MRTTYTERTAHFEHKSDYEYVFYFLPHLIALESCKQASC
jgi:hypothetical protein